MKAHGAQLNLDAEGCKHLGAQAQTSSAYRNLFGDVRDPNDRYKGLVTQDREKSREMFRWLAARLGQSYWPEGKGENDKIPAGYTYLAQFVIHDTIQSLNDLPKADA